MSELVETGNYFTEIDKTIITSELIGVSLVGGENFDGKVVGKFSKA